jgi:NAD+ synthase
MRFKHFEEQNIVYSILNEIKSRHQGGYKVLLRKIREQICKYYQRNNANNGTNDLKFIIGLSGGIDSSLATYLSAKAISSENVIPITMPARNDDYDCIKKATIVRKELNINNPNLKYVIPIIGIVEKEIEVINNLNCESIKINTSFESQNIEDR